MTEREPESSTGKIYKTFSLLCNFSQEGDFLFIISFLEVIPIPSSKLHLSGFWFYFGLCFCCLAYYL